MDKTEDGAIHGQSNNKATFESKNEDFCHKNENVDRESCLWAMYTHPEKSWNR